MEKEGSQLGLRAPIEVRKERRGLGISMSRYTGVTSTYSIYEGSSSGKNFPRDFDLLSMKDARCTSILFVP